MFAGEGEVSKHAKALGAQVETFGPATGWNFLQPHHRHLFLKKLQQERPDEILLSPMCGPWSKLQAINLAKDPARYTVLQHRKAHYAILVFTQTVFGAQKRAGRHAHVEHPVGADSWDTPAWRKMRGHDGILNQCRVGLRIPGQGLVKKPTHFRSTKDSFASGISLP